MISTSICFGWWAECPQECHAVEPDKNQEKCLVWRNCNKDWIESGGRLGIFDIINSEKGV
jgi:hypothetical protein